MIKNKIVFEVKKNERIYELYVSPDSPLGELYDALAEIQFHVLERMKEAQPKKEEIKIDDQPMA